MHTGHLPRSCERQIDRKSHQTRCMAALVSQEDLRQQVLHRSVSSGSASGGGVFDQHVDHRLARPAFKVGAFIATRILSTSHDKTFCEELTVKSIVPSSWSPDVAVIYPALSPLTAPGSHQRENRHQAYLRPTPHSRNGSWGNVTGDLQPWSRLDRTMWGMLPWLDFVRDYHPGGQNLGRGVIMQGMSDTNA